MDVLARAAANSQVPTLKPQQQPGHAGQSVNEDSPARLAVARANATALARFLGPRHAPSCAWLRAVFADATGCVDCRVVATGALLVEGQLAWSDVLAVMDVEQDFGVELVLFLATGDRDTIVLASMSEAQLAEMWRWVEDQWGLRMTRWLATS